MLKDGPELIDCKKNAGWARHAFVMAFYCMFQNMDYLEALQFTLQKGGDTDTNACIVGGLIGAWTGI